MPKHVLDSSKFAAPSKLLQRLSIAKAYLSMGEDSSEESESENSAVEVDVEVKSLESKSDKEEEEEEEERIRNEGEKEKGVKEKEKEKEKGEEGSKGRKGVGNADDDDDDVRARKSKSMRGSIAHSRGKSYVGKDEKEKGKSLRSLSEVSNPSCPGQVNNKSVSMRSSRWSSPSHSISNSHSRSISKRGLSQNHGQGHGQNQDRSNNDNDNESHSPRSEDLSGYLWGGEGGGNEAHEADDELLRMVEDEEGLR